jgi:hypothetical protein
MSTLKEIEAAADALTAQEKQELFLFLTARLGLRASSRPRATFPASRLIDGADDEEQMRRIQAVGEYATRGV